MAITKILETQGVEDIFEKVTPAPNLVERFTLAEKEAEKVRLLRRIDVIDADIAEAKAIKVK
jgi:hypothetical protein